MKRTDDVAFLVHLNSQVALMPSLKYFHNILENLEEGFEHLSYIYERILIKTNEHTLPSR